MRCKLKLGLDCSWCSRGSGCGCEEQGLNRRENLRDVDGLILAWLFFFLMMVQRVVLTSESIVRAIDQVLEVEVVGMKLVPLLSNKMVSGGKDSEVKLWILFVDDSLFLSLLISSLR